MAEEEVVVVEAEGSVEDLEEETQEMLGLTSDISGEPEGTDEGKRKLILKGLNGAIGSKKVTYDFARLMEGATEIKCSAFGDNMIAHM